MVIFGASVFLITFITFTMLRIILSRQQPRNDWRISQIERKLDIILQQLNIDINDTSLEEVRSRLARNKKVEALKIFRDLNPGISLKDAVSSVDAIDREMRQQNVR
jgi:ribosomal protein L7/L12